MDKYAAGTPSPADMVALESLRAKLIPLAGNLKELEHTFWINPNVPPEWPSIQRSVGSLSGLLTSIRAVLYKDDATTEIFRSLHPYPITPFNIENPAMAGLTNVILRKKPDVTDEKWIFDRLAKAQEFAHVPSDWEIEPRRQTKDDETNGVENGEDGEDSIATMFKRQRGTLDEDQLAELWRDASDIMQEEITIVQSKTTESQSSSAASSPEDAMMSDEEENEGQEKAKEPAVQRPPPMPLEVLQKFMATGMV